MVRQDELHSMLDKEIESTRKPIAKELLEARIEFDKLCLNLAKADGTMSFKEIQALNVYEFYLLKTNVMDMARRRKGSSNKEGDTQ